MRSTRLFDDATTPRTRHVQRRLRHAPDAAREATMRIDRDLTRNDGTHTTGRFDRNQSYSVCGARWNWTWWKTDGSTKPPARALKKWKYQRQAIYITALCGFGGRQRGSPAGLP
ncbi:MAG: hypothetical protein U1F83_02460 [Verrucomicrobiota bacterium]